MRKFVAYLVAALLFAVLQSILKRLFGTQTGPEFLFILVIFSGVYHKPFGGLILAFILGFVADSLWGLMPGLYAALFTITFAVCRIAGRRFYMRSHLFQIAIIAAMTFGVKLLEITFLNSVETRTNLGWGTYLILWRPLLWNAIFAIPVIFVLDRFEQFFGDEYASQFIDRREFL
ncbi:MAG: rod shape-determining protein MreD [Candidatus Lernaella stagnicola]|nr:rod shape-determining protein MreD [Candidatus Lernaella stagnicola]